MAKQRLTLDALCTHTPDIDLAKIDATTEADIARQMQEDGYDPDEPVLAGDTVVRQPKDIPHCWPRCLLLVNESPPIAARD